MTDDTIPADEAHARLCNAECMLQVLKAHLDENCGGVDEWQLSEALEGVLRLLDGCYVSLGNALQAKEKPAAATAG